MSKVQPPKDVFVFMNADNEPVAVGDTRERALYATDGTNADYLVRYELPDRKVRKLLKRAIEIMEMSLLGTRKVKLGKFAHSLELTEDFVLEAKRCLKNA